MFFFKANILPNHKGIIYKNNTVYKLADAGTYYFLKQFFTSYTSINIPLTPITQVITNQEVLTKDNIALRFSYFIRYTISDIPTYIRNFNVFKVDTYWRQNPLADAQEYLHLTSQTMLRNKITETMSEDINHQRSHIFDSILPILKEQAQPYGIIVENMALRDITFPKAIQDIFAKQLETTMRSKTDLENARTQVATARALKNASQLMQDDPNIKYLQWLETINKIGTKGNHTFIINSNNESLPIVTKSHEPR